jgi:acetyl esterase/lipase
VILTPEPIRTLVRDAESRPPAEPVVHTDVVYAHDGRRELRLDIYEPLPNRPSAPAPVVLFFHGGSWLHGDKITIRIIDRFLSRLRTQGFFVIAANYTTSPLKGISGTVTNAEHATRWVADHGAEYGWDAGKLVLYGVSAGGHLALLVGLDWQQPGSAIAGILAECAPSDLIAMRNGEAFDRSKVLRLFPEHRLRLLSPIEHLHPDAPPVLMLHGGADETVHVAQSRRLRDALSSLSVPVELYEYPEGNHAFLNLDDSVWHEQESVALDWLARSVK